MEDREGQLKDRFYLVQNPNSANDNTLYVMHNRPPRFIASVLKDASNNITINIVLNIDDTAGYNIEAKKGVCRRFVIAYYESLKNI